MGWLKIKNYISLTENFPPPLTLLLQSFLYQLCKGVAHCHSHGVLHRLVLVLESLKLRGQSC